MNSGIWIDKQEDMNNNKIVRNMAEEIIISLEDIIEKITECANTNNSSTRVIRESYRNLLPLLEEFNEKITIDMPEILEIDEYKVFTNHYKKLDTLVTFDISNFNEVENVIEYVYDMSSKIRKVIRDV